LLAKDGQMQLTQTLTRKRRERPAKSARRTPEPRPRPAMPVSQVRARRGGGNEDRALYSCECGFAWTGEVTASPGCPHCGTPQAW
jgi:rubrerythrin